MRGASFGGRSGGGRFRSAFVAGSLLAAAFPAGCGSRDAADPLANPELVDTDGDGLTDGAEGRLGTDPLRADTDGDRLDDRAEIEVGSNPLEADTDGDTYADGDEVYEGHSPTDADDRIYRGYWPYNWNKEAMKQKPITGATGALDHQFGRFALTDQFGDSVAFYDFASPDPGQGGRPVLLDVAAAGEPWDHELLDMVLGGAQEIAGYSADSFGSSDACWDGIQSGIANGEVVWFTALALDWRSQSPATQDDVAALVAEYPEAPVPVTLDPDGLLPAFTEAVGYPTVWALDGDLVVTDDDGDYISAMETVCRELGYE